MRGHESAVFVPTEDELWTGLTRAEFVVFYQPIIALATGTMTAVEALVRWQHPTHGLVTPAHFIPIADTCGFSIPLSEWVLRHAARQARDWQEQGLDLQFVSVNPAIRHFQPGSLRELLQAILTETGLDPRRFAVEVHETHLPDPDVAAIVLAELSTLGLPLWIDDFGTGPSAIRYLKHFPFTVLKLDREFVWHMATDAHWASIIGALITFAHDLGLRVVAEGITTDAQLALLRTQGCEFVQGWRYWEARITVGSSSGRTPVLIVVA